MFGRNRIPPPKPPIKMEEYPEMIMPETMPEPPKPTQKNIIKIESAKGPAFNPLSLVVWILLIGSVLVMAYVMNMGINMVVTIGYVFMSFGAVGMGFLFLIALKTPGLTFLKGFLYGKPIMEVSRKDGQIDFVLGNYGQGMVKSGKYGIYYVNPDAVKREKKSGGGVIRVIDSIGVALTEKFVVFINTMKNRFGFENIEQIEDGMKRWSECGCGFIGVPKFKVDKKTITDEHDNKKEIEEWHEVCPECGKGGSSLKRKMLPKIYYNTMKSVDWDTGDQFILYNNNPDRQEVAIEQEVKNRLQKEKQFNMKLFSILLGIGVMFMLISIGLIVLLPKLSLWMAGEAVTSAPIIPIIQG